MQSLVLELWRVSVNYIIKFIPSDLYLPKQSLNNGLSWQEVPYNRCQLNKQAPVPNSYQFPQGANDKLQGSVSHTNPCELFQLHVSKQHLSFYIMLWQEGWHLLLFELLHTQILQTVQVTCR